MNTPQSEQELFTRMGNNLRYFRNKKQLTQWEVALHVGVSRKSISRYEKGGCGVMMAGILYRLCKLYGVVPSDIVGEEKGNSKT